MGNDFNFTKSCVEAHQLCTEQFDSQQIHQHNIMSKRKKAASTQEIKNKILSYVENNKLQLYPTRQKKLLQTLVSVNQQHISDKIIHFDKQIKSLQKQKKQHSRKLNQKPSNLQNNLNQNINIKEINQKNQTLSEIQLTLKISKQKRKKLFEDAQCLLLQDLDMIFQQISKFDPNYLHINNILSLKQTLGATEKTNNDKFGVIQTKDFNKNDRQKSNDLPVLLSQINKQRTKISSKVQNSLQDRQGRNYSQRLKEVIKLEDKKVLKKNLQILKYGSQILKQNMLLIIVPIQCFNGIGVLKTNQNTGLPSGASILQILSNKIRAVNMRRKCSLGLAFLVNQKYVEQFKQEIRKTTGFEDYAILERTDINSNISNYQSAASYQQSISYHVIPFRNIWPSFDGQQKILLNQNGDEIVFSSNDGDLLAFIQNSIELKSLIQKYSYINFTNINNLLSQIGDVCVLGYLQLNQQIDIVAKILKPSTFQYQLKKHFQLDDKGFVNIIQKDQKYSKKTIQQTEAQTDKQRYCKNQPFLNIEEYYIRSRLFTTDSGPLKRLLMSRISCKMDEYSQKPSLNLFFHRQVSSMFYSKFTAFFMVEEQHQFSHIKTDMKNYLPHINKNGSMGYSRYCKKLLGIKESQQGKQKEQLVEIDAGILHKGSQELNLILKELKKVKQVGFPIILYSNLFHNQNSI